MRSSKISVLKPTSLGPPQASLLDIKSVMEAAFRPAAGEALPYNCTESCLPGPVTREALRYHVY